MLENSLASYFLGLSNPIHIIFVVSMNHLNTFSRVNNIILLQVIIFFLIEKLIIKLEMYSTGLMAFYWLSI